MRSVRYGNSDCSNEIRGTILRTEEKTERLNSLPESENYLQLNLSFLPPAMPHVNANSAGAAEGPFLMAVQGTSTQPGKHRIAMDEILLPRLHTHRFKLCFNKFT